MGAVILQHTQLKKGLSNREFNITVKNGDYFAFVGNKKSDADKIIRAIAGREKIANGDIAVNDHIITGKKKLADELIAYIPADNFFGLKKAKTVKDCIITPMIKKGYKSSEWKERYKAAIRLFELSEFEDTKISKLSPILRMCVALASASVLFPHAYLLEAPFDSMPDLTEGIKVFKSFYSKLNQTLIFSAENRETAAHITSKMIELD